MLRNKRFQILSALILITAVSLGFYLSSGNDRTLNTPLPEDLYTSSTITPPFVGDNVGSWSAGAVVTPEATMGHGESYQRNDTGWVYFTGGDQNFSGTVLSANRRYNVRTNVWTAMTPMPTNLELHGMATLKDTVYTIAGMTTNFFADETAVCRKYNVRTDTWGTIASLPVTNAGLKAVGYQDSLIYCAGGMTAGGSTGVNNVYVYNCISNTWRTATPLPAARTMGAFTVKGDTLVYVGGGTTYFAGYNNITYKGLISQADRSVITWTTGANYPGISGWRFDARPWGCKGIIVCGGGGNATFASSNECYVYSPGLNTWTQQANATTNCANAGIGSVSYASGIWKLIVASGNQYPTTPWVHTNTQIFTDTLCPPPACPFPTSFCNCDTAAYTTVTGTAGPSGDDQTITVPIGFTFCFNGASYTQASICTNGFVVLGATTYASFVVDLCGTDPTQQPMLAPYWCDLNTANGGAIVYTVLGSAPNRIFVVQYTNVAYFSGSGNVTMQVRCYENGGVVQFHYGPSVSGTSPGAVGLSKSPGGSGNVVSITPGATCPATTFSTTVCNNTVTFNTTNFPNGRRYSFNCLVGVDPVTHGIPREFSLSQNYPNPFNPSTKISYALPKAGDVKLVIFDILGREVAVLVNEFKKAGSYDIEFNGANISSGVYFYRIETRDFTDTKKMLLVK
jgi:type IX secretion system substrate protein/Kelch motif protein